MEIGRKGTCKRGGIALQWKSESHRGVFRIGGIRGCENEAVEIEGVEIEAVEIEAVKIF